MQKAKHSFFLLDNYQALGTAFWVECFDSDTNEVTRQSVASGIQKILQEFESKYSRFKEDSLVRKLSKGEKIKEDKDFLAMLEYGDRLSKDTDGLFSLFKANKLVQKGYGEKSFYIQNQEEEMSTLCHENGDIFLSHPMGVDLGGVGKGYVIDMIANYLQQEGIQYFLINGGGDMYATSDNGKGIAILLEHPLEKEMYIGEIDLYHNGFAASSSFKRMWAHEGKEKNHFVGGDEEIWGASFVVGKNALTADALATALILVSKDKKKQESLSQIYDISYMHIDEEGVFLSPTFPTLRGAH
jgi:thiamine biosynthesis lipoprotein